MKVGTESFLCVQSGGNLSLQENYILKTGFRQMAQRELAKNLLIQLITLTRNFELRVNGPHNK